MKLFVNVSIVLVVLILVIFIVTRSTIISNAEYTKPYRSSRDTSNDIYVSIRFSNDRDTNRMLNDLRHQSIKPHKVFVLYLLDGHRPSLKKPSKAYPFNVYIKECGINSCETALNRCRVACKHLVMKDTIKPSPSYIEELLEKGQGVYEDETVVSIK